MHPDTLLPHPFVLEPGGQRELSRRASERYLLLAAAAEQRQRRPRRPRRPSLVRRLRHGLAGGLVAAARLVDAT